MDIYEMAKFCKDLGELIIINYSQDTPGLAFLIDAQRKLKGVKLYSRVKQEKCEELSKALARKHSTLNSLFLYNLVGVIKHFLLAPLINLKDLSIEHVFNNEDIEVIKKFRKSLEILEFPDLQFLNFSSNLSFFKELALLIERTKGNIKGVNVFASNKSAENAGMLIKAIVNNCPKIERLSSHIGPKDLNYLKSLLLNCNDLSLLHFRGFKEHNDFGDELLDTLTKFSPRSLITVTLYGDWKISANALKSFFESFRERKSIIFYFVDIFGGYITGEHVKIAVKYFKEGILTSSNLLDYHNPLYDDYDFDDL
ncbi:hypothetical protein RclHR1_03450010 [Rhizophagus clarus]|nr:hypothetical protein RclHR1_03450010 [Rhizophagus clarus]